jgi:hypothetical protein
MGTARAEIEIIRGVYAQIAGDRGLQVDPARERPPVQPGKR